MMNSRLMSSIVPADCILFELLTVIGSHRTSSAEDFKSPRRRRARVPRRQGALQRRAARRAGLADKSVHAPRPEVHAPIGIGPAQKQGPRSMQHQGGFRRGATFREFNAACGLVMSRRSVRSDPKWA
ncbi:unnamed protein product [Prorocentrum cordatum]|uniref:Uncharacterized protein n=1 Tax=Prorocentrum cordatum TaxID=2364126 RepID=A0ABN9SCQ2_9DINO|nr:unnamed protein product [Polarella glacialis]